MKLAGQESAALESGDVFGGMREGGKGEIWMCLCQCRGSNGKGIGKVSSAEFMAIQRADRVPAHLWYSQSRDRCKPFNASAEDVETGEMGSGFGTGLSQKLQAQTDGKCGSIGLDASDEGIGKSARGEFKHGRIERADTGEENVAGTQDFSCRCGEGEGASKPRESGLNTG